MKHYRYDREYPFLDGDKSIKLTEFETLRETDCGYWIQSKHDKKRFVLKDSYKRYAYPTKEEAFNSFRIRTSKAYGYAVSNLNNAIEFINLVNKHELIDDKIIMKSLSLKTLTKQRTKKQIT